MVIEDKGLPQSLGETPNEDVDMKLGDESGVAAKHAAEVATGVADEMKQETQNDGGTKESVSAAAAVATNTETAVNVDDHAALEEDDAVEDEEEDMDDDQLATSNPDEESGNESKPTRAYKKRRIVTGDKADLYSHFSTLNEKAYTKGGKDLGLYLCICKYCQSAYEKAKQEWLALPTPEQRLAQPEPMAPQPFPRTRRYCVNHQKQCPHIPKDTAMAVVGAALSNAPKLRTRASGTFTPAGPTTPAPSAAIKTPATTDRKSVV